jgi:hypothetical protein
MFARTSTSGTLCEHRTRGAPQVGFSDADWRMSARTCAANAGAAAERDSLIREDRDGAHLSRGRHPWMFDALLRMQRS